MHHVLMASIDLLHHLDPKPDVVNPGGGEAPPGAEKIEKLIKWVMWLVSAACVAGILIVAGKMVLSHQRGQASEHAVALGWAMFGCILAGSASGIAGALL